MSRNNRNAVPEISQRKRGQFGNLEKCKRYQCIETIGKGSYAVKQMTQVFEDEISTKRAYRETYILRNLNHENVVSLVDVVSSVIDLKYLKAHSRIRSKSTEETENRSIPFHSLYLPVPRNIGTLYLVFEHVDTDLAKIIKSNQYMSREHVQFITFQILQGIKYIHDMNVIHRDLKPANILVSCSDCTIKIADFGLARVVDSEPISGKSEGFIPSPMNSRDDFEYEEDLQSIRISIDTDSKGPPKVFSSPPPALKRDLTKHVVTRWYRAPEVVLAQPYTSAVDIWSVGCIFAELLTMLDRKLDFRRRRPLFPGDSCGELSAEDVLDDLDLFNSHGVNSFTDYPVENPLEVSRSTLPREVFNTSNDPESSNKKGDSNIFNANLEGILDSFNPLSKNKEPICEDSRLPPINNNSVLSQSYLKNQQEEKLKRRMFYDLNRQHSQLSVILDVLGTPSSDQIRHLDDVSQQLIAAMKKKKSRNFSQIFAGAEPEGVDLIKGLLDFDPSSRLLPTAAMSHPYFDPIKSQGYISNSNKTSPSTTGNQESDTDNLSSSNVRFTGQQVTHRSGSSTEAMTPDGASSLSSGSPLQGVGRGETIQDSNKRVRYKQFCDVRNDIGLHNKSRLTPLMMENESKINGENNLQRKIVQEILCYVDRRRAEGYVSSKSEMTAEVSPESVSYAAENSHG